VNLCGYKQCTAPGCTKFASFGYLGGERLRCGAHRPGDMVNLKYKRCTAAGCTSKATFGHPGGRRRYRCAAHRLGSMADLTARRQRKRKVPPIAPDMGEGGEGPSRPIGTHKTSRTLGAGWSCAPRACIPQARAPQAPVLHGLGPLLSLCEMAERELYGR
jgi:hypothetical protein